jgi:hypothetical protein
MGPKKVKSPMQPAEGYVWCHKHGAIHADSTDPYDYGEPDCETVDHRPVFWEAHRDDEEMKGTISSDGHMLMLVATPVLPEDDPEAQTSTVYAIRFFSSTEGAKRVRLLATKQIRQRHPEIKNVRKEVVFTVYEPRLNVGGWPHWLGPAAYYE